MGEKKDIVQCLPEESWVRKWIACFPHAEMPRSYMLFGALALIGAVYGRSVFVPADWREIYPLLNLLLIGPSGVGKTSALELGFKYLLRPLPDGVRPAIIEKATPEKLHWDLRSEPKAIIYAEELAALITRQKYMESMIPYLTRLFNYLPRLEERTKANDVVVVENPEACLLGGSTIKWLQEQLPDSAVSGGFLPRFLIIYEQYKWQRVALPELVIGRGERVRLERRRQEAADEFAGIIGEFSGPIKWADYSVADIYTVWYSQHQPESGHLEPFAQRAGEYIQRLAMLIALSCHRNVLTEADLRTALALYDYSEKSLQRVVVPYSMDGQLLELVLDCVGNRAMDRVEIRHAMKNFVTAKKADELVDSLMASRDLKIVDNHILRTTR